MPRAPSLARRGGRFEDLDAGEAPPVRRFRVTLGR